MRQYKQEKRDDVFTGTPDSWIARFQIQRCASDQKRAMCIIDISVAFMHADIEEHLIVKGPQGVKSTTGFWKLKKAVNGIRKASQSFQESCAKHVIEWGFTRNDHNPALYYDADRDVNVEEHGYDFLVDGPRDQVLALGPLFQEAFLVKK